VFPYTLNPLPGRLVPRFTEKGFKIFQIPAHIQQRLKAYVDEGLAKNDAQLRQEEKTLGSYRCVAFPPSRICWFTPIEDVMVVIIFSCDLGLYRSRCGSHS
jgi:hypothetical protein